MYFPKITIITPSYNQGTYIEQTIQSVLCQNYPNLEYIIIDGGSTDNTVEIIRKYENQLSFWISEPDKGQTDAINKGFHKSTGEIINWLNSDDYYEKNTLWKIAEIFSDNPDKDVICGKEWGFYNDECENKIFHPGSIIKPTVEETIFIGIIDQPCTFFRYSAIASIFPLDDSLHYVMDRELWWRYLLKNGQSKILQVEDEFTYFRIHPDSKSVSENFLFEEEFNRLRFSLLNQLGAPEILLKQIKVGNEALKRFWDVRKSYKANLLAEFSYSYAVKAYVRDDVYTASFLMRYLKSLKGFSMKKQHWKLWIKTNVIPISYLKVIKWLKKHNA